MIDLRLALLGNLKEYYRAQYINGARAVKRSVGKAATGLKGDLRRQTVRAGLDRNSKPGRSVAKSWQDKVYPERKVSMGASSLVYSKFPKAMDAFTKGFTISAPGGKWLAVPSSEVGETGNRKLRARELVRRFKLRFILTRNPNLALLIGEKGGKDVIYYYLYKKVRARKLIDLDGASEKWNSRLPGYIISEWAKSEAKTTETLGSLLGNG